MTAADNPASPPQRSFGGKWAYVVIALTLLFVLMPFLIWRATWFGRPLTDAQLEYALTHSSNPLETQHALSQVADRINRGDSTVKRFYPQVVALSSSQFDEIRNMDAWVMGQDNTVSEFHAALLCLLEDPKAMVQRNAALSLVRFHDPAGRSVIASMLEPYVLKAPFSGAIEERLKPSDTVNPGTLVATIKEGRAKGEVRTPVPGTIDRWLVSNDTNVVTGEPIVSVFPSGQEAWEALRALYLIGQPEDLPLIAQYARGSDALPPQIAEQARLTMEAIHERLGATTPPATPQ